MTTTADFYDDHHSHARWLGSLQGDADPETLRSIPCGRLMLETTDPMTFADAVLDLLDIWNDENLGHGYPPDQGWPWLWPDSGDTDWIYTFARGRVWITTGRAWRRTTPPIARQRRTTS
jgi:hypothetical protein